VYVRCMCAWMSMRLSGTVKEVTETYRTLLVRWNISGMHQKTSKPDPGAILNITRCAHGGKACT